MAADAIRSAFALAERIAESSELAERVRADPKGEVRKLAEQVVRESPRVVDTDPWIYRIVVSALGGTVLTVVVGAILLGANAHEVPEVLTAIGSAAVGALAGLLAPSPRRG